MINVPPVNISFGRQVSEATLCYHKSFWKKNKFTEKRKNCEAEYMCSKKKDCKIIDWKDVIVALNHNGNTTDRQTFGEPNGCHFGWSDNLFLFITNLA